jgi:hypothetical protein
VRRFVLALLVAVALAGCTSGEPVGHEPADRLVVVSMPGVSWVDVRSGAVPNLRAFAGEAAIGNLATRVGRREATTAAAYLTMGAGTRAVAPVAASGVSLEPGEAYHAESAADVLERRLGRVPDGIAYLAIGAARDSNERSAYGADVGLLGDALVAAGVSRSVVANADVREGRVDDDAYRRSAVAMLMDHDGLVDGGAVARTLLAEDADAAYGVRLDEAAVDAALDGALADERTVVLVEASDLTRATEYARNADAERRRVMRREALAAADDMLGAVLDRVGERDAVLVLSPVSPPGAPDLAVVALRSPGGDTGLLRSATTRRDGYVQLADVAPTVLAVVGAPGVDDIEGRPFLVTDGAGSDLVDDLATAGELAAFRDDIVPMTVTVLIVVLAVLSVLGLTRRRLPAPVVAALPFMAAVVLGALPATFLSAVVGIADPVRYVLLLLGGGLVVATVAKLADRRWPGTMPIVSVGAVVLLISLDVLVGARLQLNTVFGYSVAVAGRFAGVGNLAFALLGAGALVLAALVAERFDRRGRRIAIGVLVAVLLVDGLPVLGADVGGVLSIVPAFGLAVLVLLGRRIGWWEIAGVLAAAFIALLGVAFLDLARPDADQTHLARLAHHILEARWEPFLNSISRRWTASFGSGDTGAWVVLVLLAVIVLGFLAQRVVAARRRPTARRTLAAPEAAAAIGLGVLALIGLFANDSSFAVPFTMLLVVAPVLIQRLEPVP